MIRHYRSYMSFLLTCTIFWTPVQAVDTSGTAGNWVDYAFPAAVATAALLGAYCTSRNQPQESKHQPQESPKKPVSPMRSWNFSTFKRIDPKILAVPSSTALIVHPLHDPSTSRKLVVYSPHDRSTASQAPESVVDETDTEEVLPIEEVSAIPAEQRAQPELEVADEYEAIEESNNPPTQLVPFTQEEAKGVIIGHSNTQNSRLMRLLRAGADTQLKNNEGKTALDLAKDENAYEILHSYISINE